MTSLSRNSAVANNRVGQIMRRDANNREHGQSVSIIRGRLGKNTVVDQHVAERQGRSGRRACEYHGKAFPRGFGSKPHNSQMGKFRLAPATPIAPQLPCVSLVHWVAALRSKARKI